MRSTTRAAVLLVTLVVVGCGSGASPTTPSATATSTTPTSTAGGLYLSQVLDTMQANSINRYQIDWTAFRQSVNQYVPNPQTIADTYPAISRALGLLYDHHSMFRKSDGSYIYNPNPNPAACRESQAPIPTVPSDIGYVRVGGFSGSGTVAVDFAVDIQNQIAGRDSTGLRGWIVDLRGNGGGNMYPMIAGLGPILGDGTAGAFIDPDGQVSYWGYSNGASTNMSYVVMQVPNPYTLLVPAPQVAVLTDCFVASSGEASVISFRGRPNTRSFGTPTYGLSTANRSFPMSDGATLILTVALMADRNLTRYGFSVVPDEIIRDTSATVDRAIEWLRQQ